MSAYSSRLHEAGFSLIELLVVIGISVMLTGLMLINMRSYTDYAELEGEVYKIATLAREAQTYAVSTKNTYSGVNKSYPSVGLYIVDESSSIILFGEEIPNNTYDLGTDSVIRTLTLIDGYQIINVCGSIDDVSCSDLSPVSATYVRPFISMNIKGGTPGAYAYIQITVRSQKGNIRKIQLWTTGQVKIV